MKHIQSPHSRDKVMSFSLPMKFKKIYSIFYRQRNTATMSQTTSQARWMFSIFIVIKVSQYVTAIPLTDGATRSTRVAPEGPQFWVVPCGFPVTGNDPAASDSALAGDYALQLGVDINYVDNWKENFGQDKFKMSFEAKVREDAPFRYDWLQVSATIPKNPGQRLNETYYSEQQFPAMLTESSNIFQRIAIGWEQVDFEKTDTYYSNQFTSTKNRMKNTLCELDYILAEKQMDAALNPTRSIMPSELRTISAASQRDERNFRILKEYVNALEYYADGFNYFKISLSS